MSYEVNTYRIELCCPGLGTGAEKPVTGALSTERLSLSQYGFRIANPYDIIGTAASYPIPFKNGAGVITSGYLGAHDVQLMGTIFDSTSYGLWNSIARDYLLRWLSIAAIRRDTYLRIGLWNGATIQWFRLYCVLRESNIPFVPGTQMTVASPIQLTFFAYDPVLYEDTEGSVSINVSGGFGQAQPVNDITLPGINRPVFRSIYTWTNPSGTDPMTRLIANDIMTGITTTVTDTLSPGHQMVVDNWNGLVYGGSSTALTNRMDKLTGGFWWSGNPTAHWHINSLPTSIAFTFYISFLKPAANYFVTQQYAA